MRRTELKVIGRHHLHYLPKRESVTKAGTVGFLGKPFKQECFINYLVKALIGCKYKRTER
jgi:FixJ family two-component response regulator